MDPKNERNWRVYAIVSGFVFETLLVITLGFFAGYYLDQWLGTRVVFTIVLLIFSVFYAVYHLIRRVNKTEDQDGSKQ